ncbi:DotG [Gluconacetobacter sacchari]|uniref:DotG n=1 Tax=Gluconacetobacter sacchari TaxID=92759 RepID=A0A7W4IF28_9PROT|nr:DotG [Gluconacetobacter sacchari]
MLPAGRGIYADMVTTADSDHPTEVFADVTTGPFIGARLIGSFQKSGDTRLVVKFSRLVIGKQPEIAVDGLAVAPDTMETFVASSVEEHLLTRALLPAAMEFASGLSQAMQTGNTTGISNGLGVTTFSHLNLPQELAVAGGTAAQGVLRILQQTTPQQSTVRLEHKTTIGVIFVQAVREKV